jgi:hypothetical protein
VARSPAWMRGRKRRGACTAHVAVGWVLLKRRRGRQGRGGGPGFGAAWRGKRRRGSVTWTGTAQTRRLWAAPTAASGACLIGVAGAGCKQGRTAVCMTQNDATNRWGRATSGPGGSDRGAAVVRASRVARRRALDGRADSIVPPRSVLNRFKTVQTDSNLLNLWPTQKVSSLPPKIRNKIWLERG